MHIYRYIHTQHNRQWQVCWTQFIIIIHMWSRERNFFTNPPFLEREPKKGNNKESSISQQQLVLLVIVLLLHLQVFISSSFAPWILRSMAPFSLSFSFSLISLSHSLHCRLKSTLTQSSLLYSTRDTLSCPSLLKRRCFYKR